MTDHDEAERRPSEELRRIARYQRWLMACVLTQLALWVGCAALSVSGRTFGLGDDFALALTVILGSAGGIYAFLIYWTVRDPLWAAVMGLASMPPFLGVLTLVAVNVTATRALTANGVAVGLFGADADAIAGEFAWLGEDADW